jgi:uncharacterized protein YcbK (DUF882 family)
MGDVGKFFFREEFTCPCGCGQDTVDAELIWVLDALRIRMGRTTVTSGIRCKNHNASIGGASNSQHLYGKAADIKVMGRSVDEVATYLEEMYPNKYGIGRYDSWVHIDVRPKRARWKK